MKRASPAIHRQTPVFLGLLLCLLVGALFSMRFLDLSTASSLQIIPQPSQKHPQETLKSPKRLLPRIQVSLNCTLAQNQTRTCPRNYPTSFQADDDLDRPSTCPDYYHWIHEDLPWKATGITEDMVARAGRTANFYLTIVDGRAYVVCYQKSFQSRDTFMMWGILQLLRRYPGKVPDDASMAGLTKPIYVNKELLQLKRSSNPAEQPATDAAGDAAAGAGSRASSTV